MDLKTKVGIGMKNDLLKREVTFLYVKRQMREEMDLAWKDFFEKNPDKKEKDVWRRIEQLLRSKQDPKDQGKEISDLKEIREEATRWKADDLLSKGSMATRKTATPVKSILSEKKLNANDSTKAYALGRREKKAPLILKRRIWWEPVPGASSYIVYVSKDRTIFEPVSFSWERTSGIIAKLVIGKTELVIPDEWPEFPTELGTYYIGITSRDDIGNQSDPFLLSGLFKFLAPSAPLRGGIDYL